ncbi:Ig-like domain-containing protein [Phenylobacterium sp. LjRoot225]|uniref:Ig-like domain-containing protein n=1 Tax=Phenylobacterium sp. LjRoot225 TaxID=3342285 RepID=UPI003ED14AD4
MPMTNLSSSTPAPPSGLADSAIVNGYVNNVRDTASQALTGLADAGVTIRVYNGATQLGTAVADESGAWSFTLGRLADGPYKLTATAVDAEGHVSAASEILSFKVDTRPPSKPGTLADAAISKGYVNAEHNTASQAFTGKTDAGATVTVYDGETQLGIVKAGGDGTWSFTLGQLSEGAHKLTATATDIVGNTSDRSDILAFTVDTHAPGAPTNLADAKIVGGYVNAAHDVANQALTGKAQAYAFVTVYDGATKLGQVQASGTGTWSYTLGKLADGDHSLTATAADKAGNTSAPSAALAFTVDTHAPPAFINLVQETAPGTLLFTGGTEPGATITVSEGPTTPLGALVADADGNWNLTLSGVADDRPYDFWVTATDAAGNKSAAKALAIYNGGWIFYGDGGNTIVGGHAVVGGGYGSAMNDAYPPTRLVYHLGNATGLKDHARGGDNILNFGHNSSPAPDGPAITVFGDSLFITDYASGGDDWIVAFAGPGANSIATAIGDAERLSGHATGGNDLVDPLGMTLSVGIGDANFLTDYAHGGDDVVVLSGGGPHGSTTLGYGDAEIMSGHSVGGDDIVTARTAYGDAKTLTDDAQGGNDVVTGRLDYPSFESTLFGDGAELLGNAHGGEDTLVGDSSTADQMWGDAATVSATATTGADLFLFHPGGGHDQIMDFELGKDLIEIADFGFSDFADLSSHFQTTSDGVLISLDTDNDVLVRGVTVAQLTAGDFVFS